MMCPQCGHNLTADELVERGRWTLAPNEVFRSGERIRVTPQQACFLHTLAGAFPRSVITSAVGRRISTTDDPYKLANVVAWQLRRRLPGAPFETAHGIGYRWSEAA